MGGRRKRDVPTPSARTPLVARRWVDLAPWLPPGEGPLAVGIAGDGSVLAAAGRTDAPLMERRRGAGFPKSRLAEGIAYTVVSWSAGEVREASVVREELVVSYVQPTAAGFLLVGARCHWRPRGAETNAAEYDWDGRLLRRFTAGDGIRDVRTTPSGATWVSYFDEGVFGNYGWNHPGPEPVGASGCVRFDESGEARFRFSSADAGTDMICDAYAMNVAGDDDVWLYFYTEFPLVHFRAGRYRVWECGIGGAQALAVSAPRVLLHGDYRERDLVRVLRLGDDGRARCEAERLLRDEDDLPLDAVRGVGVGADLFVVRGREVLVVDDW